MSTPRPTALDLVNQFLVEPDLNKRAVLTNAATDGLSPNEAVTVLWSALNFAIERLRSALEVSFLETGVPQEVLIEKMRLKLESREADYVNYQFDTITQQLRSEG